MCPIACAEMYVIKSLIFLFCFVRSKLIRFACYNLMSNTSNYRPEIYNENINHAPKSPSGRLKMKIHTESPKYLKSHYTHWHQPRRCSWLWTRPEASQPKTHPLPPPTPPISHCLEYFECAFFHPHTTFRPQFHSGFRNRSLVKVNRVIHAVILSRIHRTH